MHKSTILFATCALLLSALTGWVGYLVWQEQHTSSPASGAVKGAEIGLALPADEQRELESMFDAKSALLWEQETGRIVFEQNGFERVPIASITKLMTAMVALDAGIDFEAEETILPSEYRPGGRLLLHRGERVRVKDLWAASLLGSANNATVAYVRAVGIDEEEFVRRMNRKAIALGLEQTTFVDVTGLHPGNVSTAYEVARMASVAFTQYPQIAEYASMAEYKMVTLGNEREHVIRNTNKLMRDGKAFIGSKTGFLYEAGYCLVVSGTDKQAGRIAVILGGESEPSHFRDTWQLLQYQ